MDVLLPHAFAFTCMVQVPKDNVDEFKSIKKFKVFNTNNLWARLDSIDELLSRKEADFEVIANKKVRGVGLHLQYSRIAAIKKAPCSSDINLGLALEGDFVIDSIEPSVDSGRSLFAHAFEFYIPYSLVTLLEGEKEGEGGREGGEGREGGRGVGGRGGEGGEHYRASFF